MKKKKKKKKPQTHDSNTKYVQNFEKKKMMRTNANDPNERKRNKHK